MSFFTPMYLLLCSEVLCWDAQFSQKYLQWASHSSPVRVKYGVPIVSPKSSLCLYPSPTKLERGVYWFNLVAVLLYSVLCYVWLHDNGTQLYPIVGIDHVFASGAVVGRSTTHEWCRPLLRAQLRAEPGDPTCAWWRVQPRLLTQKRGQISILPWS